MDPLRILTHEMWEKILSKLEDPQDRLNLIWTNSELERAFQQKKVEWGFAAALPIIVRRYACSQDSDKDQVKHAFTQCRLVSSTCNKALEKYVAKYWNEIQLQSPELIFSNPTLFSRRGICKFFDRVKDNPLENCPIFSRALALVCDFTEDPHESMMDVSVCLIERIGQHLYGIAIWPSSFPSVPALLQYLASLLQQLPNLNYVCYYSGPIFEDPDDVNVAPIQPLPVLPVLPHLKFLDVRDSSHGFADELTQHICFIRYFPQLTTLSIPLKFWREAYNVEGLFTNLQTLRIQGVDLAEEDEVEENDSDHDSDNDSSDNDSSDNDDDDDAAEENDVDEDFASDSDNDEEEAGDNTDTVLKKMFKLFKNLDAPQLKMVMISSLGTLYPSKECEQIDKSASILEQMGTCLLSKRDPRMKWKGREEYAFPSVHFEGDKYPTVYKCHDIKWYNLSKMKLPPLKISKPPTPTTQKISQRKGGMCVIV